VLAAAVPGAATSPGKRICSLVTAPTLTAMGGLVLMVMAVCVTFEAVTVALPAVLSVTLKVRVPLASGALAGKAAFASLELIATVSLVLTRFQLASTDLTVTLNAVPAVCPDGVPVLPVAVPGAAVSPGTKSCNFASAPTLTVIEGLVLAVLLPSSRSVAVTVALPAVLSVTLNVLAPLTSAALAGPALAGSEELIPTVSV